jgi:hypothetical protein
MGRSRLRTNPGNPSPKVQTSPSTKSKVQHQHHSDRGPKVGGRAIALLQGSAGNRAVANLIERKDEKAALAPEQRDSLLEAAKRMFEQGLNMIPGAIGPVTQLIGATGVTPGSPPPMVFEAMGTVSAAISVLDAGFQLYEQAGGDLSEVAELAKSRAHLSTALFFLKLIQSGTPMGGLAQKHVLAAMLAGNKYRVDEAVKLATSGADEQGPVSESDYHKKQALARVIKDVHLGPPGERPSIGA